MPNVVGQLKENDLDECEILITFKSDIPKAPYTSWIEFTLFTLPS